MVTRVIHRDDMEKALATIPNLDDLLRGIPAESLEQSKWDLAFQVLFPGEHVAYDEKREMRISHRAVVAHSTDLVQFLGDRERAHLQGEDLLTTQFYPEI